MKAGGQTAGVGVCLLLGVGDLVVLNTVLVPDYIQSQSSELTVVHTPRPTHVAKAAPVRPEPPASKAPAPAPDAAPAPAPAPDVAPAPAPEAAAARPTHSAKALAARTAVPAAPPQRLADKTAAPAPEAAPSAQSWLLHFAHNKSVLSRRAQRTLAKVTKAAQPGLRVVVEGHSNDIGPSEYNRLLSRRRAEAVVRWLTRHGVAKEVIVVGWHGEDRPKLVKKTRTARSLNRRVEVTVQEL